MSFLMRPLTVRVSLGPYLWLGAAELLAKAAGFALMVVLTRHFGLDAFGQLCFASSIIACLVIVSSCGLDVLGVRHLALAPASAGSLVSTIVILRLLAAAAAYAVLLVSVVVVTLPGQVAALAALYGLTLFSGSVAIPWAAEGLQRARVLACANLALHILTLVFTLAAITATGGLWFIPLMAVLAQTCVAGGLWVWMTRQVGLPEVPLPVVCWLDLIRQGLPISGARLLRAFTILSDTFILGWVASMEDLGAYSGPHRLFLFSLSIAGLYFVVALPRWVACTRDDGGRLLRKVRESLYVVLPIVVLIGTAVSLHAASILETLLDIRLQASVTSLQILLVALAANIVNGHYRNGLLAQGRQGTDCLLVLAACGIHCASKLILVPIAGITGSALGTLFGETSLAFFGWMALIAVRPDRSGQTSVADGEEDSREAA